MAGIGLVSTAVMVVGDAELDEFYLGFTAYDWMKITGLQAVVRGTPPSGSCVRFRLFVNNVSTGQDVSIADGQGYGYSVTPFEVICNLEDEISFKCIAIGSGNPGSWIEIKLKYETNIIFKEK